ncbi:MAG: SMC family ATPase [Candidatus Altiarchaeota archaeon]|nr:SMC family ATPase [Candidatus Altiarchaeota archaeon]
MKFLSLELENWACHKSLDIDLRDGLQIEGRNGTGKSSILEAIRFIFARDARRYRSRIRNGARSARVKLSFSRDGNLHDIEKKLFLDKNKSSQAWMSLNGERIKDNPTSIYSYLQQEIFGENIMERLIYVPQGKLTELIDELDRKGGREELDSLLGLDVFQRVYEGAGQEYREKKGSYESLNNEFMRYDENTGEVLANEMKNQEGELETLARQQKKKEDEINRLQESIKELRKEISVMQETRRVKEEIEKKIIELRSKIEGGRSRLHDLKQILKQLEGGKAQLTELEGKEKSLSRYSGFKGMLDELRIKKEKLPDLDEIEAKKKQLNEFDAGEKEKIEEEYRREESDLSSVEREIASRKQTLRETKEYLISLGELNSGAECPRCHQMLTKKHLKDEETRAEEKIKSLREVLEKLEFLFDEKKSAVEKLKKELRAAERRVIEYTHLREEVERLDKDYLEGEKSITKLEEALKDRGYQGESPRQVEENIGELNRIRGKVENLREETSRMEEYRSRMEETDKSLSINVRKEKEEVNKQEKLVFDEPSFEGLGKEKEKLQEEMSGSRVMMQKIESEHREVEGRILEFKKKRREYLELRNRADKARESMNLLKEARDGIYHPSKGIRKYYREIYLKKLSNLLTYYFRRINDNPKFREISFDENYSIEIRSTEGVFDLNQLSGGERVQLAVAFRIALVELLSPIHMLILDEPFGSLDAEHKEAMGEALNRVSEKGQLILVTHVPVESLDLPNKLRLEGY